MPDSPLRLGRPARRTVRRRPRLEVLEDRCVPANFSVTTNADDGVGSLRAALATANVNGESDTIVIENGVGTIGLTSGQLEVSEAGQQTDILGPVGGFTLQRGAGAPDFRLLHVGPGALVGLSLATLTGGRVLGPGGAILNEGTLTLTSVALRDNEALTDTSVNPAVPGPGGAIANALGAILLLDASLVETNRTLASDGGGIANFGDLTLLESTVQANLAGFHGGGVENQGALTVVNSTLNTNRALGGGGAIRNSGDLILVNVTLSSNLAGEDGGAVLHSGAAAVVHTTITGNRSGTSTVPSGRGAVALTDPLATGNVRLTIDNSIVAGNLLGERGSDPSDVATGANYLDLSAASSNNLIGDAASAGGLVDGQSGNLVGVGGVGVRDIATVLNPQLGAFGGPTNTHALVPGSPAVDAGNNAFSVDEFGQPLTRDQRGQLRPQNGTVDLGALEGTGTPPPTLAVALGAGPTVTEGNTGTVAAAFAVALSGPAPAGGAVVVVNTFNGSATGGVDYTPLVDNQVTIPEGQTSVSFSVLVTGDTTVEANETFAVALTLPVGSALVLAPPTTATATITNDDQSGTVGFTATTYSATEGAANVITLARTGDVSGTATVLLRVAQPGGPRGASVNDVSAPSVSVTFGAGVTSTAVLGFFDDLLVEGPETFTVDLVSPTNAGLGTSIATVTILDNDGTPTERFINETYIRTVEVQADPAGLNFWTNYLLVQNPGTPGREFLGQFLLGTEQGRRIQLNLLYQQYLGRNVDEGGRVFWTGLLNAKRVNLDQVASLMVSTPEYLQRSGSTANGFADALVLAATGRARNASDPAVPAGLLDTTPFDVTGDGRIDALDGGFTIGQFLRFAYALSVTGGDGRGGVPADQFAVNQFYQRAGVAVDTDFNLYVNQLQTFFTKPPLFPFADDVVFAQILAKANP